MIRLLRTIARPLLLAGLCFTGSFAQETGIVPTDKEQFHLYLLMGQSNMAGRDTTVLASQTENPRVLALNYNGSWVLAKDPIHEKIGRVEPGVGPGIPFAREMIRTDPKVTIGLVPCAVGGSPLKRWVKGGDLYQKAIERAKTAAESGIIKGVLWHQGETDASKEAWANRYKDSLAQMFKDLRDDLGIPNLPIVVGQLGDFVLENSATTPHAETVRTAIQEVAETAPNVGFADAAGLKDLGDKLHFNADASKEMGARFARAMQELQKKRERAIWSDTGGSAVTP